MRRIYEHRTDTMSQHLPNTAILTTWEFIAHQSSDGSKEYFRGFEIRLFGKSFRKGYFKEDTNATN